MADVRESFLEEVSSGFLGKPFEIPFEVNFGGAFDGGGVFVVTSVYITEPANTMPAPAPSCVFHPFPNHHTLKHRLIALRVVKTRFVDTDETRCKTQFSSVDWKQVGIRE